MCAWAHPVDAIYVEGTDNTDEQWFSPRERFGYTYQINYLRCISCGMYIETCPTCALTMANEFKLTDKTRGKLICEKQNPLAPLAAGMGQPPYPCRLGDNERAYFPGLPPTGQSDTRTVPEQGMVK